MDLIDPFAGGRRDDLRFAQVCAIVASAASGKEQSVEDYVLIKPEKSPFRQEVQTADEMRERLIMLAKWFGATMA